MVGLRILKLQPMGTNPADCWKLNNKAKKNPNQEPSTEVELTHVTKVHSEDLESIRIIKNAIIRYQKESH